MPSNTNNMQMVMFHPTPVDVTENPPVYFQGSADEWVGQYLAPMRHHMAMGVKANKLVPGHDKAVAYAKHFEGLIAQQKVEVEQFKAEYQRAQTALNGIHVENARDICRIFDAHKAAVEARNSLGFSRTKLDRLQTHLEQWRREVCYHDEALADADKDIAFFGRVVGLYNGFKEAKQDEQQGQSA